MERKIVRWNAKSSHPESRGGKERKISEDFFLLLHLPQSLFEGIRNFFAEKPPSPRCVITGPKFNEVFMSLEKMGWGGWLVGWFRTVLRVVMDEWISAGVGVLRGDFVG